MGDLAVTPPHEQVSQPSYWEGGIDLVKIDRLTGMLDNSFADRRGPEIISRIAKLVRFFSLPTTVYESDRVYDGAYLPLLDDPNGFALLKVVEDHKMQLQDDSTGHHYRSLFLKDTLRDSIGKELFDERAKAMMSEFLYLGQVASFFDPDQDALFHRNVSYLQTSRTKHQFYAVGSYGVLPAEGSDEAGVQVVPASMVGQVYVSKMGTGNRFFQKIINAEVVRRN